MRLNGKFAPITSAVSGIDHAIAKCPVDADGRVVIADLDPAKAARAAKRARRRENRDWHAHDVSNEAERLFR